MGSQQPGISALDELMATGEHDLFVVSPPAEQMRYWHESAHDWAVERGLPAAQPEDVNSDAFYTVASTFAPDLILSVFYNQVLGRRILELPRLGPLNVHPSLLPEYRGAGVLLWALMDGASEVGVTIHFMEERVDAGDIVLQRAIPVRPDDTGFGLYRRVADLVREVFRDEFLDMLRNQGFPRRPMPYLAEPYSRHTPRRNEIDWEQPANTVVNIVRALTTPLDGAFTEYERERLYIWRAAVVDDLPPPDGPPGTMAVVEGMTRLVVGAGDERAVELLEVGYAGQQTPARDFVARHWKQRPRVKDERGVVYRAWREDDDPACVEMLAPMGWIGSERYARKFNDDGLVPGSVLIADSDGEACGHSITALRRFIAGDARIRTATIGQVVVRPDFRGRGIGSGLLEQSLQFADAHRTALVWLTAKRDQGVAYDMYRRRGFERVQARLTAQWSPGAADADLHVHQVTATNTTELMNLRRTYAATTGAVQDRDFDQALAWSWYLISRNDLPRAAVRIRADRALAVVTAVLFDTNEDPAPYMAAAIRSAGFSDAEVHASPASALTAWMPDLEWHRRPGEHLVFVPSLRRLVHALLPLFRQRAAALGLRGARVTFVRGTSRVAVAAVRGEARITRPRPDDTRIVFSGEGLAAMFLGALAPENAERTGTIEVRAGSLASASALAWVFPHRYCDFTQHSAW